MVNDLKKSFLVLRECLSDVIDELDKLEKDGFLDYRRELDKFERGFEDRKKENKSDYLKVLDDFPSLPSLVEYTVDSGIDDNGNFTLSMPYDSSKENKFEYYATEDDELILIVTGYHNGSSFATSNTVDIPEGFDQERIFHIVADGKVTVIVPPKRRKRKTKENVLFKKRRPTDFNYLHQLRDEKGRFRRGIKD